MYGLQTPNTFASVETIRSHNTMTSLYLPPPSHSGHNVPSLTSKHTKAVESTKTNPTRSTTSRTVSNAPSYEERCDAALRLASLPPEQQKALREKKPLFVPRSLSDFDDGGAFPEIHVAQYPRHMGNPHLTKGVPTQGHANPASSSSNSRSNALVPLSVDESGRKDYSALITSGTNADKIVYTKRSDMRGILTPAAEDIALPTKEEEEATAEKTALALQSRISTHLALSKPSGSAMMNASMSNNRESNTQFIHYTPSPDAPGYNPIAAKRVIQMVPAQVDPMMPPKHRHVKAPRGPAEDPVPVLHAPPEKLTVEERKSWDIPACISNWKNSKGYTIPLDKRLAADGRGLRDDGTINSNFATLSESLYLAERQAREEVRMRSMVQKKQIEMDRERREAELRDLASRARMERSGMASQAPIRMEPTIDDETTERKSMRDFIPYDDDEEGSLHSHVEDHDHGMDGRSTAQSHEMKSIPSGTVVEDEDAQKRERLRIARRRERDREYRMQAHQVMQPGTDDNVMIKKARLEEDRDVSEKIALGVLTGTGSSSGGVDGRLYNQSSGFVSIWFICQRHFNISTHFDFLHFTSKDSGFGAEDEYNVFNKPLFDRDGVTSSSIYRPTRGEATFDADEQYDKLVKGATSKFIPDKGFAGAEGVRGTVSNGPRNAPVQFEKSSK